MNRTLTRAAAAVLAGGLVLGVGGTGAWGTSTHSAHAKPTYSIAYEGPLTGGAAYLGLNEEYAAELAVNNANAGKSFGDLPFKLKFLPEDDQGSGAVSPTVAQALVTNSSVMAVVGPAFSGATRAAEPTYSAADLATVTPSATNVALAQRGWHNFFRVVANDAVQGYNDALYSVRKFHASKIVSIDDASTYGQGLVQEYNSDAAALHKTPTHDTAPSTVQCGNGGTGSPTEYQALSIEVAKALKSQKHPLVFYGGYYCDFALLTKALRGAGYTGALMSGDGSEDPHYVVEAGKSAANGVFLSCPCTESTLSGKGVAAFEAGFLKLAKYKVSTYSAEAFDATNAIIDVMKSLKGHISRSAIVNGLHTVRYQGLTKVIHFKSNGNIAGTTVYMYQVQKGHIVQLGIISKLA